MSAPALPLLGASIAVFRDGRVLIARRGRGWMAGAFSLPGGRVECGERLAAAAERELLEETGVRASASLFVDHVEIIEPGAAAGTGAHFVVCAFAGAWQAGEPRLSPEASEFRWVDPDDPGALPFTPEMPRLLRRAGALMRANGG